MAAILNSFAAEEPIVPPAAPISQVSTQLVVVTNIVVVTNLVVSTNTVRVTNTVGMASPAPSPENVFATAWWSQGLNYRLTQRIALGPPNEAGEQFVNERITLTGRIGVKLALDGATFIPTEGEQDVPTSGEIRTLRFYTTGNFMWRLPMYFKLELGLINNNEFYLHEAFLRFKEVPLVKNVTLGYLVTPFSLENVTAFGNLMFMEPASPVQAFAPGNRMAFQLDGNWRDQRMSYHAGIFALGQSTSLNFGDASQGLARAMGRITGLPLYEDRDDHFRLLHLGLATSYVFSDTATMRYRSRPEAHLAPFLVDTGDIDGRDALQLGAEVAYVNGPFTLQGELIASGVDDQITGNRLFWGGYGYAGWFLTRDHRAYNKVVGAFSGFVPRQTFHPFKGQWGAFEVGARYSYLDLSDGPIDGGCMHTFMPGLNWYWSQYARLEFNYGWSIVDGGPSPGDLHIFQARLQLSF